MRLGLCDRFANNIQQRLEKFDAITLGGSGVKSLSSYLNCYNFGINLGYISQMCRIVWDKVGFIPN
jgi:hypothetical protein